MRSPGSPRPPFEVALLFLCACSSVEQEPPTLAQRLCTWEDHANNPLIQPPLGEELLGDPTVLTPEESPDDRWHLFANSLAGIHHYGSDQGVAWATVQLSVVQGAAMRPFVFLEDGAWHLLYERFSGLSTSEIVRITSSDLETWTEPVVVIAPELEWETTPQATVGNPYVTRRDGQYWLYYSASGAELPDTGFPEPLWIGLARADSLDGPWIREPSPILGPDPDDPWRNHGAGSIKLLDDPVGGLTIALTNGIYIDDGVTGSAIRVASSQDGVEWQDVCDAPVLRPEGEGWKAAYIYGFDTARTEGGELRVYYNARDGWVPGVERVGMATLLGQ